MFLSRVFIAQGCGDSDPCGDSGHCAVFELNHLKPSLFPHPWAETPTCAILIETKALLWGVSNAHACAKTATCAIKTNHSQDSRVFIAQGCDDSDPCGDSGHCAVFELNHLEPSSFPHPWAETPTCAILIETKALLWGVSDAHACAKTCLLYTSPSPRDGLLSRMPSSA